MRTNQWESVSDSQLLAAIEGRYDVFVTLDRNIPFQQDLSGRSFAAARPGSDAGGISEPDASAHGRDQRGRTG
jgi:hypothetical protein